MRRLQFAIRRSPDGPLLADWSHVVRGVTWSTGPHGFRDLQARVPRQLLTAFQIYEPNGSLHVEVNAGAYRVWEGRVDDPALRIGPDGTEIQISALGYWQAYRDIRHTVLWGTTDLNDWQPMTSDDIDGNWTPTLYTMDTQNRLFIAPQKNATYPSLGGVARGELRTIIPDQARRGLARVSFDYTVLLPDATWGAFCLNRGYAASTGKFSQIGGAIWSVTGNGAAQTGSVNVTFTGSNALGFQIRRSGVPVTLTTETGTYFLKITNLRLYATSATSLTADEIVRDIITAVRERNADQASASDALIDAPGIDLRNEVYEDAEPAQILAHLARLGSTTGVRYEVGVKRDRTLYFRPRGSAGRSWVVDASDLDIQQTRENLFNSVYARYQDASGRTLRTPLKSDQSSIDRYGIVRESSVDADTTNVTSAEQIRDVALGDTADPRPRAGMSFTRVYTTQGQAAPLWMVESGDLMTIRNLPPGIGQSTDRIRTFYIAETEYTSETRQLRVVPEEPLPSLDVLVARQAL